MVTKAANELPIVGGAPALDLANTLDGPRDAPVTGDFLRDYDELVAWAVHAGVVASPPAAGAARGPRVLERVKVLRAAVDDAFRAIAAGRDPPPSALATVVDHGAQALAAGRLVAAGGAFALVWDEDGPERILWPVAHDAIELLRHGPLDRVKCCTGCRWLFVDVSRNHSRRWCTMDECGVRSKMRRYRAKRATAGR